jgi:hypothetical protein
MIKEIADKKLDDGSILCRHTIEIYCPACGRDVDDSELAAKKCNDCGVDLSTPEMHVAVMVANLSSGGATL